MQAIEQGKEALRTIWRNKALWFFGVFVAGGSGGGGGGSGGGGAGGGAEALPGWLIPVLVAAAIFGVVMFVLHVVSEAALIEGVRRGRGRGDGDRLGVRQGLRMGLGHFWRVLGIKLGMAAAMLVTVAVVAVPALLGLLPVIPLWLGLVLTGLLALPAVPWLLTVYFLYEYALRFSVLERQGVRAATAKAYRFLHGRLVDSLQTLLVVIVGRFVGTAGALVLLVPVGLLAVALYFAGGLPLAIGVGAGLGLPLLLVSTGIIGAYASAVWTLGVLGDGAEPAAG